MDQLQAFYRVNHEHLIRFNFHAWTVTTASPSISNDILKFLIKIYHKINIFHFFRLREQMTLVDGSGWRHLVSSQCGTFQVVNAQKPKYLSSYPHGRTVAVTQRSRLVVKLFNFRNILHDGEQFYSAPYTITSGTAKHI